MDRKWLAILVYVVAISCGTGTKILRSIWSPVGTNIGEIVLPIQSPIVHTAHGIQELSSVHFIDIFTSSRNPIRLGIHSVTSLDRGKRGRFQICGRALIFMTSWINWRWYVWIPQGNLASHCNIQRHRSSEVS